VKIWSEIRESGPRYANMVGELYRTVACWQMLLTVSERMNAAGRPMEYEMLNTASCIIDSCIIGLHVEDYYSS
jgi:hypothetical protein